MVLFCLIVMFDLLNDIGEGDGLHPLCGGGLDLLVVGTEDRLDGLSHRALVIGGGVDMEELMIHLEGLVDV